MFCHFIHKFCVDFFLLSFFIFFLVFFIPVVWDFEVSVEEVLKDVFIDAGD